MRWPTQDHMPSRPRYSVPVGPDTVGSAGSVRATGAPSLVDLRGRMDQRAPGTGCDRTAASLGAYRRGTTALVRTCPCVTNATVPCARLARMTAAGGRTASRIEGFAAVVPAGGAGTRLWPLSRAGAPKFLHDLTGSGRSLLQATWDRLVPLAGDDRVLLVTGRSHAAAVREALPGLRGENLLLEPSPRDSMAAIGLAAAVLERREGAQAVLGSFAADHVITDDAAFGDAVRQAVATARTGEVVTIGITPTGPATQFGYVRGAEPLIRVPSGGHSSPPRRPPPPFSPVRG